MTLPLPPSKVLAQHKGGVVPACGPYLCPLCETNDSEPLVDMKKLVSKAYTDWEQLLQATEICRSCAFLITDKEMKLYPLLVKIDEVVSVQIMDAIASNPTLEGMSLLVPLARKKQLGTYTKWNHFTNDKGTFLWDSYYLELSAKLELLLEAGFTQSDVLTSSFPVNPITLTRDIDIFSLWNEVSSYAHREDKILETLLALRKK